MKRTVTLTIKGNSYNVDYPNTGQQIDVELLKAKITEGQYDALRFSASIACQQQADKIDMIATFSVVIPQLKNDINTDSLFKLSEEESDQLTEVYNKQYLPWYREIKDAIKNPKAALSDQETAKDSLDSKNED
jgi:hypothetical protein